MSENKNLEELVKAEKREYYKQYRAKHKDRVNENNRRYWERRALKRQRKEQESEAETHENK